MSDSSSVRIQIFDLAGSHVATIVDGEYRAGEHHAVWDGRPFRGPSSVFEVRYDVWTPGRGSLTYQDTVYAAFYADRPSHESAIMGYTDSQGAVGTSDPIKFPHLWSYPTLVATDFSGQVIGTFTFLDTLVVVVTDTASGVSKAYERGLSKESNVFDLTWTEVD